MVVVVVVAILAALRILLLILTLCLSLYFSIYVSLTHTFSLSLTHSPLFYLSPSIVVITDFDYAAGKCVIDAIST